MNIAITLLADVLYIKVNGRFGFSVYTEFREAIKLAAKKEVMQIEVNLENTTYVDSAALGMLLILQDKKSGKIPMKIVNAKNDVKTILEIVNFNNLFTLC